VNAEQASKDQDAEADLSVFQGRPPSWREKKSNDITSTIPPG
jgi:hypothetical protein